MRLFVVAVLPGDEPPAAAAWLRAEQVRPQQPWLGHVERVLRVRHDAFGGECGVAGPGPGLPGPHRPPGERGGLRRGGGAALTIHGGRSIHSMKVFPALLCPSL